MLMVTKEVTYEYFMLKKKQLRLYVDEYSFLLLLMFFMCTMSSFAFSSQGCLVKLMLFWCFWLVLLVCLECSSAHLPIKSIHIAAQRQTSCQRVATMSTDKNAFQCLKWKNKHGIQKSEKGSNITVHAKYIYPSKVHMSDLRKHLQVCSLICRYVA